MNLTQAQAEMQARGFQYLDASRLTNFLNRGLVDFEDFWRWPWLTKTATGPAPLTIADLKFVLKVFDANGNELFGLSDAEDLDYTQTGTPTDWWIDETSGSPVLVAYPVGAATFSVRYVAETTPLAAGTDTPLIPSRYHNLWIDLAIVHAYRDRDNFAASGALKATATQELWGLVERYDSRNRMNSRMQRVRAGSGDD